MVVIPPPAKGLGMRDGDGAAAESEAALPALVFGVVGVDGNNAAMGVPPGVFLEGWLGLPTRPEYEDGRRRPDVALGALMPLMLPVLRRPLLGVAAGGATVAAVVEEPLPCSEVPATVVAVSASSTAAAAAVTETAVVSSNGRIGEPDAESRLGACRISCGELSQVSPSPTVSTVSAAAFAAALSTPPPSQSPSPSPTPASSLSRPSSSLPLPPLRTLLAPLKLSLLLLTLVMPPSLSPAAAFSPSTAVGAVAGVGDDAGEEQTDGGAGDDGPGGGGTAARNPSADTEYIDDGV